MNEAQNKPLKSWIIEKIIFPIGDRLFKTQVSKQLKIQRAYNTMDADQLDRIQRDKLSKVLKHATSSCKAYSAYQKEETEDPAIWLKKFPVLTKRKLASEVDNYISSDFD